MAAPGNIVRPLRGSLAGRRVDRRDVFCTTPEGKTANRSSKRVKWTISFAHEDLTPGEIRMLSAIVEADVRMMQLAHEGAYDRSIVEQVRSSLASRFPHVVFRIVASDADARRPMSGE